MERFKPKLADWLSQALSSESPELKILPQEIETPQDRAFGDFAFPCFRLAKTLRKNPAIVAQELAEKVKSLVPQNDFMVSLAGPYVNFTLSTDTTIDTILKEILDPQGQAAPYGSLPEKSREKWIFEYSSPNVAKPFQIYHLRTTIVGSTLSKIARMRGYNVTTINHLGDWGVQYGKLALALKKYEKTLPAELTLNDLVKIYIQIHKDIETDPTLEKTGQELFKKLEQGDPEMRAIWKKCVDISLREFAKVYARYQVHFDHYWGESYYEPYLKPLMGDLRKEGILVEDQGAQIVRVTSRSGQEIPPCIIEKSDGASIYATRDLAAAIYRYEQFHFDRMSYIVGKEQMLHFEQVFGTLRAMKKDWEPKCEHIPTGLYRFKDSKMSTRKGNFVTLEEVTEMCLEKAQKLMNERAAAATEGAQQVLTAQEIATISEQVAIGAIVFADLSTDPTRDLEFDVDRVISFEGETGPYLQYAHTRCLSILRKAGTLGTSDLKSAHAHLKTKEELFLLKTLGRFPSTLERTLDQRKPSQLASYLIDLTRDFGVFYRECKVMNEDQTELTKARLSLVEATRKILAQGLDLLGIPKPEKM